MHSTTCVCEATRWHTGATNVEKLIYHLKRLIVELASQEADGTQASDIFPTSPLQEGFVSFSGKSLADLRGELPDLEGRLFHLRAGSSMLAWSYFEKLVALENMSVDRSEGTSSLSNPMPTSAREVTVESLLDCLVWATNRFGQLASVIGKVQDAATSMAESSGVVNPKLDAQHTSLLRMSDGILALAANIKVNGEQGAPILAGVKAIPEATGKLCLASQRLRRQACQCEREGIVDEPGKEHWRESSQHYEVGGECHQIP